MSTKQPVIRFSPFKALLIGEKNRILKQQPMKDTIFVTKLNRRNRSINLRDLFGLEKNHKNSQSKGVFKISQSVHDFFKNKNYAIHTKKEVLCYKFEGQKVSIKNHNKDLEDKKVMIKSNKVKFKKKVKCKGNSNKNFGETFCNRKYNYTKNQNVIPKAVFRGIEKRGYNGNRHLLRGKDGKFISKSEYEKFKSNQVSTKQRLTNNIYQMHLKKKNFFTTDKSKKKKNLNYFQMPYNIENIVGIPESQKPFDLSESETMITEMFGKYYENNYIERFQFPKLPKQDKFSDFEDDCNLLDIIYESLPKFVQFESTNNSEDFSIALRNSKIFTHNENLKIYEKEENDIDGNESVSLILKDHVSCINLEKPNVLNITHSSIKHIRGGLTPTIDEPYTEKNHLISGKNLASFFLRSVERKDIFIGNLVKPFWQNSWFGSLTKF